MPKSHHPLAYQKKRSPKKSTRPVVGPGREPDHIRSNLLPTRGWVLVFVAIIAVGGIALGLALSLGGSPKPAVPPFGATTTSSQISNTPTLPSTTTTVPSSTTAPTTVPPTTTTTK